MKVRKILTLVISLFLAFTMLMPALVMADPVELLHSEVEVSLFNGDSISADPRTEGMDDDTELRVIVELTEKPVIAYATEKGVKVSKLEKKLLKSLKSNLEKSKHKVKQEISNNKLKIKYHYDFSVAVNGFSATTTLGSAKKIEGIAGVAKVSIANEYERPIVDMGTSKDIVNTIQTWNLGYNGEGTVISIIDSGIDPTHKDMRLSNPEKAALTQQAVTEMAAEENMRGKWHTGKVPYGYNYYDQNDIIMDIGTGASMHGMHVGGTAAANSSDDTGVKGVAPEAQLLAMKVFSNDPKFPSTFADIYIGAVEDSIIIGADVINMSLGSTAAFVRPNDPEQMALARAAENGVVISISAGNSGHVGQGFASLPYAKNPDIGVVGSPGLNANSIQVASIENTHVYADALMYKDGLIGYQKAGSPSPHPVGILNGQMEYVYCKLGLVGVNKGVKVNDFDGVDVSGKIALIQRGGYDEIPGNFVDKIMNAQQRGAVGVIVFNSAAGGEALMNMAYPEAGTVPAVFIGLSDGSKLLSLIEGGENKVEFGTDKKLTANPETGKMAVSSSWGATPNLDFKPELTAPGGNIYSTLNSNGYGIMSGTSMAAPHVAGGAALVLQRVDEEFALEGYQRHIMAKNLLMSTAKPLVDLSLYNNAYKTGNFVSPRKHGAGVMDLLAAATTPAIVTDGETGVSKVNLREIGRVSSFMLRVTNFSDEAVSYKIGGTVTTDLALSGRNRIEPQGIYKAGTEDFPIFFSVNGQEISALEVPANSYKDFDVTIDLNNTELWATGRDISLSFPNGAFVEGFVRLTSETETIPSIGVPYLGFFGDWDKAPIIDDNNYNAVRAPFYGGYTVMTWLDGTTYRFLGYPLAGQPDATKIAFSPNGDNKADSARFLGTFLRNAKDFEINILSKEGKLLRIITKEYEIRKNFYNSGSGTMYRSNASWEWDGKLNNKLAADGEYIYQVKARVDYQDAEWQTVNFPIWVDTAAPEIKGAVYDKATKTLNIQAADNHAVRQYEIMAEGKQPTSSAVGSFDLSSYAEGKYLVTIKAHDFAWNVTEKVVEVVISNDSTPPMIYLDSPSVLAIYNTNTITTAGYATDDSELRELKVNNTAVAFTYDQEAGRYYFEHKLNMAEGGQTIKYEAVDIAGNIMSITRKIFVDTKAPEINVTLPEKVAAEVDKLTITGKVSDNLPALKVKVNGSMIYNSSPSWMFVDGEAPVVYDIAGCEVELEMGDNLIVIEAMDDAGHTTTREYNVYRGTIVVEPLAILNMAVNPADKVSSSNPVTISAAANYEADWQVVIKNWKGAVVKSFSKSSSASFEETWTPANDNKLNGNYTVEIKATKGSETVTKTAAFTVDNKKSKK